MIILLYLIVIFGWALLILVIKCRKAREKRIALAQQEAQNHQNAVHVIQIGNSFYDVIPITDPSVSRCHHHSHCRRGYNNRHGDIDNSHTNPTFVLDEGVFPSAPHLEAAPPPYEEVIRLPNQYPKVISSTTVSPVNENPPPTIAEIEANGHSITTITSHSPSVITSQHRSQPSVT